MHQQMWLRLLRYFAEALVVAWKTACQHCIAIPNVLTMCLISEPDHLSVRVWFYHVPCSIFSPILIQSSKACEYIVYGKANHTPYPD